MTQLDFDRSMMELKLRKQSLLDEIAQINSSIEFLQEQKNSIVGEQQGRGQKRSTMIYWEMSISQNNIVTLREFPRYERRERRFFHPLKVTQLLIVPVV